jgi:hypothetical protein
MISPGRRVTRASTVKGNKQKVLEITLKKKNHPRHALPMINDPVLSSVLPKYFERASINLPGHALPVMAIVDISAWLEVYPDPWHPTRLSLVETASEMNLWYSFLYDILLDGKLSRWGDGSSNVLSLLIKSDILKLTRIGIDLVPLIIYKFVFACLPCLWTSKKTTSGPKSPPLSVSSLFFKI